MSLSLSIVIPTLNEAAHMNTVLASLAPLRRQGAQVIIADGGSDDGTRGCGADADVVITAPRGRARQMNAGAALARGEWLLFLHADTRLPVDAAAIFATIERCAPAQWGFFPVKLSGQALVFRVIERAMSWRSRVSQIGTGDQALFVRRSTFDALRGFAEIPLMEDVELSKRLRRRGCPVVPNRPVVTSSRRWEEKGVLRTVLMMWYLRAAYACGAAPSWLARRYYPGTAGR